MMAIGLGCAWLVLANVLAMLPSRDNHWARAYVLMAVGVPLLGYIIYENGPWIGLAFLIAACSIMRWPVIYLGRWVQKLIGGSRG